MLVLFAQTLAFVTQMMSKLGAQPNLTASNWDQPPYRSSAYSGYGIYEYAWGYVWHAPGPDERPTPRGIGNGLSWGFEPSFCRAILPTIREHSPAYASGVTCDDLKAATRRALSAWSLNNDAIAWYERHPPANCPTSVFNLTANEGVREAMKQCNAGMLPFNLAGECEWAGGCALTEVMIGTRNDDGLCTYGNCSNNDYYTCRAEANECGTTPAREDGYYAARLANFSSEFGPAGSSTWQAGMYDSCSYNEGLRGPECVLPPLRAPNGFVQYYSDGTPFLNIETFGGIISLNRDDCFYLDATFCGGALASAAESSAKARRRALWLHSPPQSPNAFFQPSPPPSSPPPPVHRPLRARRRVASATTSPR